MKIIKLEFPIFWYETFFLCLKQVYCCLTFVCVYRYHKLRKTFGKFFRSYSELLSKFGDISFQEYLSKGISHPVFYGDLVYKLRMVKDTPNFILSGSKIVKRLRRRQYDPVIIERTIGLVLGPSTALYEPFLKHCTLTNKAVGTLWRAFIFNNFSEIFKIWTIKIKNILGTIERPNKMVLKQDEGYSVQVADRRRWQSAMTSPIGDVGSKKGDLKVA